MPYTAKDVSFSSKKCDVKYGPNSVSGNLKHYHISVPENKGVGAELTFYSTSSPWRPGTGYYDFEDDRYFTWLCVMPRADVKGTLTYDGKTIQVNGHGYHDHQWGSIDQLTDFNNWLWGRQDFGDYNILIFDMVASAQYDHQRLPIIFVEDKQGNVVFENVEPKNVNYEVYDEFLQKETGKYYPKESKYTIKANDQEISYSLKVTKEVESQDYYGPDPLELENNLTNST